MTDRKPYIDGPHTYAGACHCGDVRYEVDIDFSSSPSTRCNCTHCRKTGWWAMSVKPAAFRLRSAAPDPDTANPEVARYDCPRCRVAVYTQGDMPELGGAFVNINLRTLDVDLHGVPVVYLDGLADTWDFIRSAPYQDPFMLTPETNP